MTTETRQGFEIVCSQTNDVVHFVDCYGKDSRAMARIGAALYDQIEVQAFYIREVNPMTDTTRPTVCPYATQYGTPQKFQDARKSLGVTQEELAVILGMGKGGSRSVRRWEAEGGKVNPLAACCIGFILEQAAGKMR